MGNCQAAEAATVVIQHPGNKIERIYWSVSANQVMISNPGHYVALVITSPTQPLNNENGKPLPPKKQLKLLRPDDTLLVGHVYRLISFEDVLKEFAAKKCVKLGKLLKESGGLGLGGIELKRKDHLPTTASNLNSRLNSKSQNCSSVKVEQEVNRMGSSGGSSSGSGHHGSSSGHHGSSSGHHGSSNRYMRHHVGGGQWRPALQSIAEIGT